VLAAVAKLRHLESLSLARCVELPGVCLAELTPLDRSLLVLDLSGCGQLTDADVRCVGELSCLRELRLRGCCQLTDAGEVSVEEMITHRRRAAGPAPARLLPAHGRRQVAYMIFR